MSTITYEQFIKNHNGKGVDYDGTAGVQCVDLAKAYLKEVYNITPGSWGNAHCYYDNYSAITSLKNNFARIPNTADFVPQKGDIVVWDSGLSSGGYGHIAIATGEGNTSYFYSYDQNWTGKHDPCTKIKHTYSHVAGVLRYKTKTTTTTTTTKTTTKTPSQGDKLSLKNVKLYASITAKTNVALLTGTFYLYDGKKVSDRYRITNNKSYCGKTPESKYVTGWISSNDI
jgi:hypothetical protein